ncbi:MAG: IPT/TIG domain-containing protein [Phyllobacterium sp.]|uniref:IPT/TIG domain-containing protein n=1 Tax=Phyllobacterium sp. TaxID=1871046 RepID=UPI0030F1A98F
MPLISMLILFTSLVRASAEPPSISEVTPPYGRGGTTVRIHGKNLFGTTQVFFGDIPTNFRVEGPNTVSAEVPFLPNQVEGSQIVEVWLKAGGTQVKGRPFEIRLIQLLKHKGAKVHAER